MTGFVAAKKGEEPAEGRFFFFYKPSPWALSGSFVFSINVLYEVLRLMKIGGLTFENPFVLAPMAGITDSPFRRLCRRMGCALTYSEMISAKALQYGDKNTKKLLRATEEELPLAYQIFGSDPDAIAFAARALGPEKNCLLDINMGCPVPKVVKNGEGSALLKRLDLAAELIERAVKEAGKPVSVKIRIGFEKDHNNAVETARMAEAAGASCVAVHGRSREQYYSGKADWETIRRVKEAVNIPVMGNGDVWSARDGIRMLEETGVDFVMVGRGALGNPWIFRELKALWEAGGKDLTAIPPRPSLSQVVETMRWQLEQMEKDKGEYAAVREMRKHVGWYIKGFPGAAGIRQKVNTIGNIDDLYRFLTIITC